MDDIIKELSLLLEKKLIASYGKPLKDDETLELGEHVAWIGISQHQFDLIEAPLMEHRWHPTKLFLGLEFKVSPNAPENATAQQLVSRCAYNITKFTRKFFPFLS